MNKNSVIRFSLVAVALGIVGVSLWFSNRLATRLAIEEQRKVENWAEAQRRFVQADLSGGDFDFVWKIIEENDNIPVLIVDTAGNVLTARNFDEPAENTAQFYAEKYEKLSKNQQPIEIKIDDNESQFIYYDDSFLLKQLQIFPYAQFGIIAIFVVFVILVLISTQKSEQNRVWVGLSKETAHQLGTPISSLVAWNEMLKMRYPTDQMVNEMGSDVERLKTIAERFSKIGSKPEFAKIDVNDAVEHAVDYMRRRTSKKVEVEIRSRCKSEIYICTPLFDWVIENLYKNAIDAMEGCGKIAIEITKNERNQTLIDLSDTGKGMERSQIRRIFTPGYTTKQRGWGLGLSLARRIINNYHGGKIFVKHSEPGCGTTFRIVLKGTKV